jgi:NAD(P)-dependent dehydrogenase (short-subunit alcohol dehydrogenase family)
MENNVLKPGWSAVDMPDTQGRTAIVTGASSGVGFEIVLQLAQHGAHVIMASRSQDRTEQAARRIETAEFFSAMLMER